MIGEACFCARELSVALADELDIAVRLLSNLAFDLSEDPETVRRHVVGLQQIDKVTQMQLIVADVLRNCADRDTLSARISLDDMAQRLGPVIDGFVSPPEDR